MSEERFQKLFNEYYRFKEQYLNTIRNSQRKIREKNISEQEKLRQIKELKPKCVNCKRPVGSSFSENSRTLKVVCGDAVKPCDLNIELYIGKKENVNDIINDIETTIDELKEKIIKLKLDLVYSYKSEEQISTEFTELKKKYINLQKLLDSLVEKKKRIFNTDEKKIVSMELKKQLEKTVSIINQKIETYNATKELKNIEEVVVIFNDNILDIINNISQNKFEKQYIQIINNNDNTMFRLIQDEVSSEKMLITLMNDEKSKIIQ